MKKLLFIFSAVLLLAAGQSYADKGDAIGSEIGQNAALNMGGQESNFGPQDKGPNNQPGKGKKASLEGQIIVDSPFIAVKVKSPLVVTGQAVGPWFFEGSFPVTLLDKKGKVLAQGSATSPESWMTEKMIPFSVELNFDPGKEKWGTLVLEKDNPSGLPENAEKLEILVRFR